jgi:hypothetical protein
MRDYHSLEHFSRNNSITLNIRMSVIRCRIKAADVRGRRSFDVVSAELNDHSSVAHPVSVLYWRPDRRGARGIVQAFLSVVVCLYPDVLAIVLSVSLAAVDRLGSK